GWWWPFRGAVVCTERPVCVHRDERGRLHCEDGAAIAYPDGWGVYAIHGVRVPAEIVLHPERISIKQCREERNAELRRVLIERYGQGRYLLDSGARVVHQDEFGTLYRAVLGDDEP